MKFCVVVLALVTTAVQVPGELLSQSSFSLPPLQHGFTDFVPRESYGNQQFSGRCVEGEVRGADGQCARAKITKSFYVFNAPPASRLPVGPPPYLPDPKIHYNFVFIRSPQISGSANPIVLPPPQQKTLVYVLSKRPGAQDQEVIEVPSQAVPPEVFFVNYAPGDDTQLPGGVSLQEALGRSAQQGEIIDASSQREFGGNRVNANHIAEVDDKNLDHEHRSFEQIYRENVALPSKSSSHRPVRPIPHHVPYGPDKTHFDDTRTPAPIEILPPAPFYPTVV